MSHTVKTYLPRLRFLLNVICKYIARYRNTIVKVVGEENAPKVDAIVTACELLMPVLNEFIPEPQ